MLRTSLSSVTCYHRDWGGETSHQGEVWNPLLHHIRHPGGLVCVVLSCVYLWSDISSLDVSHIVVHSQVRYLKIIEKSGYQALPWVRYITQNGGMISFPSILCLSLTLNLSVWLVVNDGLVSYTVFSVTPDYQLRTTWADPVYNSLVLNSWLTCHVH